MSASLLTKKYQRGTVRWVGKVTGKVFNVEGEFRLNDQGYVLVKAYVEGRQPRNGWRGTRVCHIQRVVWFSPTPQERP